MTMFLDVTGLSDIAFANLDPISGSDGGIGTTTVADPTVVQVSYAQVSALPTADRLNALVNTAFAAPLVVTAFNGGVDPISGLTVTGNGFTYVDSTQGFDIVRIVYDAGQCFGAGIATRDTANNPISTPNPVVLYHEMSHAFHILSGTFQPNGADEPPARMDENVLRGQLNLCLRDVNSNVAACGAGSNCTGTTDAPGDTGISCFIVTAVTGSPESAEVVRLRALRDRVRGASALAGQVIDAIYGEYAEFGPAIAAQLGDEPALRGLVRSVVVGPLLAWYALAGTLAFSPRDQRAVTSACEDVAAACRGPFDADMVLLLLEQMRKGEALGDEGTRLRAIAAQVHRAAALPMASWAILEPLVEAWQSSASPARLADAVTAWLAHVPLDVIVRSDQDGRLDAELNALSQLLDFSPGVRAHIGRRLAMAWPDAADGLARRGFL